MKVYLHADDFGLSYGINQRILQAYDEGCLDGASIIANGTAFDEAVREYHKRPNLTLAVHLNYVEGRPLSDPKTIPFLVDKRGMLNASFGGLLTQYFFSSSARRQELIQQLRTEMRVQLEKVKQVLKPGAVLRVDSHRHLHMLPFVFKLLMELASEMGIQYVRIPNERFVWFFSQRGARGAYLGPNLVKYFVLKGLSCSALRQLRSQNVSTSDRFIGVLFTGTMTAEATRAAVKSLIGRVPTDGVVEVLFHPGKPEETERGLWKNRLDLERYHFHSCHDTELTTLLSDEIRSIKGLSQNANLYRHR